MQRQLLSKSDSILSRSKSVYSQRNLGTIRARKIEKKQQASTSGEMILRVLRMQYVLFQLTSFSRQLDALSAAPILATSYNSSCPRCCGCKPTKRSKIASGASSAAATAAILTGTDSLVPVEVEAAPEEASHLFLPSQMRTSRDPFLPFLFVYRSTF